MRDNTKRDREKLEYLKMLREEGEISDKEYRIQRDMILRNDRYFKEKGMPTDRRRRSNEDFLDELDKEDIERLMGDNRNSRYNNRNSRYKREDEDMEKTADYEMKDGEDEVEVGGNDEETLLGIMGNDSLEEKIGSSINETVKQETTTDKKNENNSVYDYLSKKYGIDKETIAKKEEKYKELSKGFQKIDVNSLNEDDIKDNIKEWAKSAREHEIEKTSNNLANYIAESVVEYIQNSKKLKPIKPNSFFIEKEQRDFFLSMLDKINNWEDKINNSPEEIAGDEFIGELLTDPLLNFRVIKPDLLFYEKAFSGKNGFKNFMDVVKHFLSSSQKEGIEETKKFIYENNITMFKIEKIFKL